MTVTGSHAYVADHSSGLRVIDVSTPSAPVEVGFLDTPAFASGVTVVGGYAFVADSYSGLRVVDVSTPSAPVEVGFLDTPDRALGVAVAGRHVYVAEEEAGLAIVVDCHVFVDGFESGDTSAWSMALH